MRAAHSSLRPFSASLTPAPPSTASRRATRGFSVMELTVSLAVTVIILLAVLQIFDFSSKLSRVQNNMADMQQTQRIVHYELTKQIRMTGRGGLSTGNLPAGQAIAVQDNVPNGTTLAGLGTPSVLPGTDILTVRGNFNGDIYSVNFRDQVAPAFTYSPVTGIGTLRVDAQFGAITQSLQALIDAIRPTPPTAPRPEALLLVSARNTNVYVVVELDPAASTPPAPPPAAPSVTLVFRFTGGTHTTDYAKFSSSGAGIFPDITSVARVSILEEYRYYVSTDRAIPGDNTSERVYRLSRARAYPGTTTPYDGKAANWQEDLADNVLDLQFALGVNTPNDCLMTPGDDPNCGITETTDHLNDDWLYNDNQALVAGAWDNADLYYVRMSTLVRTDKRDPTYQAPPIAAVENHGDAYTSREDRMFRRRVLTTMIDLRNL